MVEEGEAFGRSHATVLWTGWQARELPRGGEFVDQHCGGEFADRLAALLTGSMDPRHETEKDHGHTAGNPFSNQAGNCFATNSHRPGPRDSPRSGTDGRRLWQRHTISRSHHR